MKLDMGSLLKQAQKMQSAMEKAQGELASIKVEGSAGGGMVVAEANGNQEILSIKIDESLRNEDPEMLEDLLVVAINQALSNAKEAAAEEMQKVTGGLMGGMPPGMKMPFPGM